MAEKQVIVTISNPRNEVTMTHKYTLKIEDFSGEYLFSIRDLIRYYKRLQYDVQVNTQNDSGFFSSAHSLILKGLVKMEKSDGNLKDRVKCMSQFIVDDETKDWMKGLFETLGTKVLIPMGCPQRVFDKAIIETLDQNLKQASNILSSISTVCTSSFNQSKSEADETDS